MSTHNIAWSLGATPNKSLELFGAFICSHSQSDLTAADNRPLTGRQAAAYPSDRPASPATPYPKPGASTPAFRPAEPGETRRILTADTPTRRFSFIESIASISQAPFRVFRVFRGSPLSYDDLCARSRSTPPLSHPNPLQ
jgi:hypothetical protein